MKASVILPCYNAADTISIQLEALAQQQWSEPWEIIVGDNGSTDGTIEIIKQFQQRLPHLHLVDASEQRGAGHARNMAAKTAQGEVLLFCDADDEVAPGWVATMAAALQKYDFVTGLCDFTKLNEPWLVKCYEGIEGNGIIDHPYLPIGGTNNLGIKRCLHNAIGGFDEALIKLQDVDYSWRVQELGTKLHQVDDAIVHFRFRNSFKDIYHRARKMGFHEVLLHKKHQPMGMPELIKLRRSAKGLVVLTGRLLFKVRDKESFGKWLWEFAWCLGNFQGCIKYRYGLDAMSPLTLESLKV